MEKLKNSLELYHINTLKEIAETLRLAPNQNPVRKAWLVNELDSTIREKAKSRDFIGALKKTEKATLGLLLENSGMGTHRDVALPLMMAGLVYIEGQTSIIDCPKIADVLLSLMRKGLVINYTELSGMSSRRTFDPVNLFGIPQEVQAVLPRDLLKYPDVQQTSLRITPPPHIESGDPEQFLRHLFFLWSELRRQPAKKLKSGGMAKRDLRRVAGSLGLDLEEDADRLTWMITMLETLNLIEEDADTISAADNDAVTLFWGSKSASQLQELLIQYPRVNLTIALDTRALSQYSYYSQVPLQPAYELRGQTLEMIEKIAAAHWMPFSSFLAFLNSGNSGSLLLPDYTLRSLYNNLRWYGTRRKDELETALRQLDQQAVITILRELQALGIVDLGYQAPGEIPSALQATDLARAHFTNAHPPSSEALGQIILQPDFQLLAMGPVALRTLANLERFAEREKLDESVVSYRITRDSTYQAFQRGETVETILTFLTEATGQPAPQNIRRSLEAWEGQYERIVLRRDVTILQLDSSEALEKLMSDPVIRRYLHHLDDHTAWARTKDSAKVERRLWELDILPVYSKGPRADLPHSLRWRDEHLHARHPLPSLYVTGTIRRIAEDAEGGWKLTAKSVRAATATGMDVPAIIALVEDMAGISLSTEWHRRLKAWGKHYGDGQVGQVTLLHLDNEHALQELRRADPRLQRWLRPLPHAKGLAVVSDTHWEEVQALLAEWGIDIEEKRWW